MTSHALYYNLPYLKHKQKRITKTVRFSEFYTVSVLLERHIYVNCFTNFLSLSFSFFFVLVTFTFTASWLAGVKRTILKLPRVFYSKNDDCIIIWHFWHVFDTLSVYFVNITLLCSSVLCSLHCALIRVTFHDSSVTPKRIRWKIYWSFLDIALRLTRAGVS